MSETLDGFKPYIRKIDNPTVKAKKVLREEILQNMLLAPRAKEAIEACPENELYVVVQGDTISFFTVKEFEAGYVAHFGEEGEESFIADVRWNEAEQLYGITSVNLFSFRDKTVRVTVGKK